ncbi:T9SS type A sorting domain-containing protein, partial [bacterium]|nr:T9SS type A sorting domain-containing protein [bacterium]
WNFGYIWSDANSNLGTCPDNNTAQAGWYVLMSNLYETGWHDGAGGPISGWEMKHSTHIKNANVYAEAARWANGDLGTTPSATYADWDHDGDNELVIRNDRVCAVFEHIGGRAHWIFGRGGATGWEGSIAGNCNAYWEGTEGDYNDANHIAPLSDVGVGGYDYENSLYTSSIEFSGADSAVILLSNYYLQKRIKVVSGEPFLRVYYDSGPDMTYIKSGFTPDLVDVVWNADVDRLWSAGAYCGFYNPNTHAAAAIIMGNGGASHSSDFQSTILKGDEVDGQGGFGFYIFAGELADVSGLTSTTLNTLAAGLSDVFPPKAYYASYHPGTDVMEIAFGDLVQFDDVTRTNIGVDGDGDGVSDVMLDSGCAVINSADARHIRIQISAAKAAAIEALTMTDPHLHLLADAFVDLAGNGNLTQTATVGDPVALNVLPNTSITIDGFIDTTEWVSATRVLDDPDTDSEWGSSNEIYDLNLYWDATYLYLGLHGVKETDTRFTNSWLIYLDTDPGGPNGAADLTMIDNWDRNAEFSGGFKADIQYGSYGSSDGDVWHITSPTTSTQITDGVIVNTDLSADRPGSEVAISWDAIYGLGSGIVPTGAQIAMCASIAGGTDLGGDCVPNQLSAVFPVLDNFYTQIIDGDGDGVPDDFDDIVSVDEKADLPASFEILAYPNPFNSAITISLSAGVGASDARSGQVGIEIYDISGHLVADLPVTTCGSPQVVPTPVIWQPEKSVGSGVYLVRARAGGKSLVKRVVYIK